MFLRTIHKDICSCGYINFLCCAVCHYMNVPQFISSFSLDGHLYCFPSFIIATSFVIINNVSSHATARTQGIYTLSVLCDSYIYEWNFKVEGHIHPHAPPPWVIAYLVSEILEPIHTHFSRVEILSSRVSEQFSVGPKTVKFANSLMFPNWWAWNGSSFWFSLHFPD